MLESIFKGVLNISLYASVVALAIMLIKSICRQRLSPNFHYGIWSILLLKLIFPVDIKSVFSIFTFVDNVSPAPLTDKVNTLLPPINAGTLIDAASRQQGDFAAQGSVLVQEINLWNAAAIMWITGIAIMLAVLCFSYAKTNRTIRVESEKPDQRLLNILANCRSELKISSEIRVHITRSFAVPFIFGFIKPGIVLPQRIYNKLSDQGIKAILSHELMHIKRRDYLINLFLYVIKSVYWFNPFIWLAFSWMKNDGERACDSAVLKNYSEEGRGEYAKALLEVAYSAGNTLHVAAVSAFAEGNFKERVKNIMNGRSYSFLAAFIAVIIVVITGVILLTGAQAKSDNLTPGTNIAENRDENAEAEVQSLVEAFGRKLQLVSLSAPREIAEEQIKEHYAEFVAPSLLTGWLEQESFESIPGRVVSSPWPERIEVSKIEKKADSVYAVEGTIIEMTSVEMLNGGIAAVRPIGLIVEKIEERWLITALILGGYQDPSAGGNVLYTNARYGFSFSLPESWRGYSIIEGTWEGFTPGGIVPVQTGPLVSIRHPQWTSEKQRQDIPILVFTLDQWSLLSQGEFHIGAAPIGPKELGRNEEYVFALPARYNYAFPEGYEEVERILEGNPLLTEK